MNTWRDIRKDPPPNGETVLACDDLTTYIGKFLYLVDAEKPLCFDGEILTEGAPVRFMADQVPNWQPAPAAWVRPNVSETVKSADQQFAALGYRNTNYYDHLVYQCGETVIEICTTVSKWNKRTERDEPFYPDEIRACYQALCEKEKAKK